MSYFGNIWLYLLVGHVKKLSNSNNSAKGEKMYIVKNFTK